MNAIDLIVVLTLLAAIWNGWRQGFIVQVCSLAGLVAAIWLAAHYGTAAGELLKLDPQIAAPGGFVAVLVVTVLVVAIIARLLRGAFHFAGFGIPDHLLGVGVSVLKCLLLLGVLCSAFNRLNEDYTLVGPQTVRESKTYEPLLHLSQSVLPVWDWASEQVREQQPQEQE